MPALGTVCMTDNPTTWYYLFSISLGLVLLETLLRRNKTI